MLAERPKLDAALGQVAGRLGLTVKRVPGEHAGGKWRLSYTSALGRPGVLCCGRTSAPRRWTWTDGRPSSWLRPACDSPLSFRLPPRARVPRAPQRPGRDRAFADHDRRAASPPHRDEPGPSVEGAEREEAHRRRVTDAAGRADNAPGSRRKEAPPPGLEPGTVGLEGQCSIHLSYGSREGRAGFTTPAAAGLLPPRHAAIQG